MFVYLCLVLTKNKVVLGKGNAEHDGCDPLEAVNPLAALRTLTTHIEDTRGRERGLGTSKFFLFIYLKETNRKVTSRIWKVVSEIPVVLTRERRTSCSVGR